MASELKITEQYLECAPPVVVYRSLELLLRYVPKEYLEQLTSHHTYKLRGASDNPARQNLF